MSDMQAQKAFWLNKVKQGITQLQIQFVKPINDLTEAIENFMNVLAMEERQKAMEQKRSEMGQKAEEKPPK